MRIGLIGINHKQADLVLREKIATLCESRFENAKIHHPHMAYVLLSTCNRTELYFETQDLVQTHSMILNILKACHEGSIEQKVYSYFGLDCFRHLVKVTAGLDSAIVAESEIQGQVKVAYATAAKMRALPFELHYLFQKALKIAKEIRARHWVHLPRLSLEQIVYERLKQRWPDLAGKRGLFIGYSKVNRSLAAYFQKKRLPDFVWCNRTPLPCIGVPTLPWRDIEQWSTFDIIILGTKCPHNLIAQLPEEIGESKMIIDLSVPRNVAPDIGGHPHIELINMDQLVGPATSHIEGLDQLLEQIEREVIDPAIKRYVSAFLQREMTPSILRPRRSLAEA